MSKANSPVKVLRTALKRIQKGWIKHNWHVRFGDESYVCLEGALYGFCQKPQTEAQVKAADMCRKIIKERTGLYAIPAFNDHPDRTKEEVEEVVKLAIIRFETGGDEPDDKQEEDFVEFAESLLP